MNLKTITFVSISGKITDVDGPPPVRRAGAVVGSFTTSDEHPRHLVEPGRRLVSFPAGSAGPVSSCAPRRRTALWISRSGRKVVVKEAVTTGGIDFHLPVPPGKFRPRRTRRPQTLCSTAPRPTRAATSLCRVTSSTNWMKPPWKAGCGARISTIVTFTITAGLGNRFLHQE